MNTISTTRAVERCERLAALGPPPVWWRVFALRRWLRAYRAITALDISVHAEMLRSVYPADWVEKMAHQPNDTLRGLLKQDRPNMRRYVEPFSYDTDDKERP